MAGIVGVHGIGKYKYFMEAGQSVGGAAEAMRQKWDRYLHVSQGGETEDYFSEVAYYAHVLHDGPAGGHPLGFAAMDAPTHQVLIDWAKHLGLGEDLTRSLKAFTGWLLAKLDSRSASFAKLFAPEVAAYLTNPAKREKAQAIVADVIRRNQPKVLIAHSLGSVVTYETLWANPDLQVDLLITLGSPLGMRNVVFERLLPAPINGRGERPKGVGRWVNIADKDDIAAIPPDLRDSFDGIDVEELVNLDWIDFHTAEKYLGCPALTPYLQPFLA
ncbi:hypothetical protein [Nonomuraea sediminis]|uniref:hypothetical protein n=1 Tax=Nonomuraea sediminis TaxID=2835864 RepID=UPI001BDBB67B|nr:hypothetical protein [Nonomuraea sediminis]